MIHYSKCPVCDDASIKFSFSAKDNTVSGKTFEIWECNHCHALFTQDVPDEEGIGAFYDSPDYVSHTDTREGFVNEMYHRVRNITLIEKKKLIEKETGIAAGKILDVGCGIGAFLHTMKKRGWQVTGIEPDPGARDKAASMYDILPKKPSELFTLPDGHYDAITLWHVMEHVHRLHDYIEKLKALLTQNGKLFIALPNYTSTDAEKYKEHWAAYDVPRHLYHFSPHSMNIFMNRHGMKISRMKPMWFDSFYVSMLSEKYRYGKENMLSAVLSGLTSNAQALFNKEKCSSVIYICSRR